MWRRIIAGGEPGTDWKSENDGYARKPRRAYSRVQAWVPVRVTPLAPRDLDALVYDVSGRDRRFIVFSGGGLALDVDFDFVKGDLWRVELLLPAPYSQEIRAVAEAVEDSVKTLSAAATQRLALSFRHIQPIERDAIVAYSYDLQRVTLRAKSGGAVARP